MIFSVFQKIWSCEYCWYTLLWYWCYYPHGLETSGQRAYRLFWHISRYLWVFAIYMIFSVFQKKSELWVLSVHPTVVLMLLSASVERCFVSHMRDIFRKLIYFIFLIRKKSLKKNIFTFDRGHVTYDKWHMTNMTHGTWHLTHDRHRGWILEYQPKGLKLPRWGVFVLPLTQSVKIFKKKQAWHIKHHTAYAFKVL